MTQSFHPSSVDGLLSFFFYFLPFSFLFFFFVFFFSFSFFFFSFPPDDFTNFSCCTLPLKGKEVFYITLLKHSSFANFCVSSFYRLANQTESRIFILLHVGYLHLLFTPFPFLSVSIHTSPYLAGDKNDQGILFCLLLLFVCSGNGLRSWSASILESV